MQILYFYNHVAGFATVVTAEPAVHINEYSKNTAHICEPYFNLNDLKISSRYLLQFSLVSYLFALLYKSPDSICWKSFSCGLQGAYLFWEL